GHAISCMNNTRQLMLGWLMWSTDNEEKLIPNGVGSPRWVDGGMDWTGAADNTNSSKLIDSQMSSMANYIKSPGVYKCPADRYQSAQNPGPRVRSMSMNAALGG